MPPKKSTKSKRKPKLIKTQKPAERTHSIKRRAVVKPVHIAVSSVHRTSCEHAYLDYKQGQKLGHGKYGSVFELCDAKNDCPYVLKVVTFRSTFANEKANLEAKYTRFIEEVENQKKAHGIAPKIYDAWTCAGTPPFISGYGFIVMERMDGTLKQYLDTHAPPFDWIITQLRSHVERLHKLGIEHGDLHWNNIMFKGNRWYLGDFGLSRSHPTWSSDDAKLFEFERMLKETEVYNQ